MGDVADIMPNTSYVPSVVAARLSASSGPGGLDCSGDCTSDSDTDACGEDADSLPLPPVVTLGQDCQTVQPPPHPPPQMKTSGSSLCFAPPSRSAQNILTMDSVPRTIPEVTPSIGVDRKTNFAGLNTLIPPPRP